jgi:hypothetical protein
MQSAEPDDTLAEHLEMVRWSGATHGVPFDQWSVKGHPGMPVATFRQLKLYRTMKWLILKEPTRAAGPVSLATLFISFLTIGSPSFGGGLTGWNPPPSRERDDAWQYITLELAAPIVAIGLRAKEAQQARARKPRGTTEDGSTIREIIGKLCSSCRMRRHYRRRRCHQYGQSNRRQYGGSIRLRRNWVVRRERRGDCRGRPDHCNRHDLFKARNSQ